MRSVTRRSLLVIAILLVGLGLTWGQRWLLDRRLAAQGPALEEDPGTQPAPASSEPDPASLLPYLYFLDVEGWYRVTPYETVVRSPYDFGGETTEEMAQALPTLVGDWRQVGGDAYLADDPAVVFYLKHPTVALERTYRGPEGQRLTLAILGNQGEDSFLLFSHTPETCYPGVLWQVVESGRESGLLDDQPMHAQYLLTEHAETGSRLMTLYWYLWDDPQRDSRSGVLSIRVNLYLDPDQSESEALSLLWEFVRSMFPATVPWERF